MSLILKSTGLKPQGDADKSVRHGVVHGRTTNTAKRNREAHQLPAKEACGSANAVGSHRGRLHIADGSEPAERVSVWMNLQNNAEPEKQVVEEKIQLYTCVENNTELTYLQLKSRLT